MQNEKYAEYGKQYGAVRKTIYMQNMPNNMQKIVQGSYNAYFAYCMANNIMWYAK